MRLLVDTNVFLEIILDQNNAEQAKSLLQKSGEHDFFISDYALHSIGLLLFRRNQHEVFSRFLDDLINRIGMAVVMVPVREMNKVASSAQKFKLDFDDAYQYTAAETMGLTIVSFDSDFDRTSRGRKSPIEI